MPKPDVSSPTLQLALLGVAIRQRVDARVRVDLALTEVHEHALLVEAILAGGAVAAGLRTDALVECTIVVLDKMNGYEMLGDAYTGGHRRVGIWNGTPCWNGRAGGCIANGVP